MPPPNDRPAHEAADDAADNALEWGGSSAGPAVSGAPWIDEGSAENAEDPSFSRTWGPSPQLGRYELRGELGRGGMGQVMVAYDHLLQRDVALKRLVPEQQDRPEALGRLAREARITGLLEHPAIVPVLDAGEDDDGAPFYVMRLIRGRTLAEAAEQAEGLEGRLRLLRHFLGACEAVGFAHSNRVIHRDLKPDNILVGEFGETQVADWGLARWMQRPPSQPMAPVDVSAEHLGIDPEHDDGLFTRRGAVVGTPAYMSPEQARGEPVGPPSDVFSLGIVLWQLIAGRHPLAGRSSDEILRHVRAAPMPSLLEAAEEAPAELAAVAHRATALKPEDRYTDAKALADEIARYLDGRRVHAHEYTPGELLQRVVKAYRAPLMVAGVALALLAIVTAVAFVRTRAQRDRARAAEAAATAAKSEGDKHLASSLSQHAVAAMGREHRAVAETLAAASLLRAENPEARGVLAGYGLNPRPSAPVATSLPQCKRLAASASGTQLACATNHDLSLWTLRGSRFERLWTVKVRASTMAVAPAPGQLVASTAHGIRGYSLTDGALKWSVLGDKVGGVYEASTAGDVTLLHGAPGAALVLPAQATCTEPMACSGRLPMSAASYSPGRALVALLCDSGEVLVHKVGNGRQIGPPAARWPASFSSEQGPTAAAWLPDSATVLVGARDGTIALVDTETGQVLRADRLAAGQVSALAPHPNRPLAAIATGQGGVFVWHVTHHQVQARLPGHAVTALRWAEEGRELWVFGEQLHRWRLPKELRPLQFWSGMPRGGLSSAVSDGEQVALIPGTGELRVHALQTGQLVFTDLFQRRVLKGGQFAPGGGGFMAWSAGKPALRTYRLARADGRTSWSVDQTLNVFGMKRSVWLSDGMLVLAGYGSGARTLASADLQSEQVLVAPGQFLDADAPADYRFTVLVNRDGQSWLVTAAGAQKARKIREKAGAKRVAIAGDGRTMATLEDEQIVVQELAEDGGAGAAIATVRVPEGSTYGIALSGDGKLLAAGLRDSSARLWAVPRGELVAVLRGHTARVADVAFIGDWLLTASWDGSARAWDLRAIDAPPGELAAAVNGAWRMSLEEALRRSR